MKQLSASRVPPPRADEIARQAAWIWADDGIAQGRSTRFLKFHLDFRAPGDAPLRLHVTADQRFQLFLDGCPLAYGPDRSDLEHWACTSLQVTVPAGEHRLEALVWWIAEEMAVLRADPNHVPGAPSTPPPNPPMAQMTWRGGFFLAAENWAAGLSTGQGKWLVEDRTGAVSLARKNGLGYHDIGPGYRFDMAAWSNPPPAEKAVMVLPPDAPTLHGIRRPGWSLHPADLPEQQRALFSGGTLRAAKPGREEGPYSDAQGDAPEITAWDALRLEGATPLELPAGSEWTVLWDFGRYVCGYPAFAWSGGAGSEIEAEWAESLYLARPDQPPDASAPKGHRGEIAGKVWHGFGDRFVASGAAESSPGLWWRSGRYLRLRIRVGAQPLALHRIAVLETRYPMEPSDAWSASDPGWAAILPLLHRGLEAGAHETWTDSPYYEQMMYVGDTRLHALSNYACYRDDRLTRRALELFDWSRAGSLHGLVAERYPSGWRQESATYALIWIWMVRDFLLWRDDFAFVRSRLPGVRQLLESFLALRREDGLLGVVPGWPFVDWVPQWHEGCGPGVREGDSSIVSLHFVLSLQAAAEIERAVGEPPMAARFERLARQTMRALLARHWDRKENVLRDSREAPGTSEHAQALALLTGLLSPRQRAGALDALEAGRPEARCSIYFAHYLLEALALHRRGEAFFGRLQFWRDLPNLGFVSLPEQPEPTRSDCHGWGAHPLFHTYASIAGIRPAAPGFRRIRIAPMPGTLEHFDATICHPKGTIRVVGENLRADAKFRVEAPGGITWDLVPPTPPRPRSSS